MILNKLFLYFSRKILWKFSRPVSKLLFLTHQISYKDPFGNKPFTNNKEDYEINFENSVQLDEHKISKNKLFLKHKPDIQFIKNLAYTLQNVLKKTRNSYVHGFIIYSYLAEYIDCYFESISKDRQQINILDIGTARGFSALCLAKALYDKEVSGKIFTFDILPNNISFLWNSYTDIAYGPLTRMELLKIWRNLVNNYIIFFSTATFNSLRIVDIPNINFAFIDGSHFYKDVKFEIEYLLNRLNKKAIIIFDDYDKELFPGVVKACDYLFSLNKHTSFELIEIQNDRKLAIFSFS